jgi:hypothetical protein
MSTLEVVIVIVIVMVVVVVDRSSGITSVQNKTKFILLQTQAVFAYNCKLARYLKLNSYAKMKKLITQV